MTIKEEMQLIEMLTKDLKASVLEFESHAEKIRKEGHDWKPFLGHGATKEGAWLDGMSSSATSYAIERKIITIREHLNVLRKRIVYYNGKREH